MVNSLVHQWKCRRRVEKRADRAAAAAFRSLGGTLLAATIDEIFVWQGNVYRNTWARSRRLQRQTMNLNGVQVTVYIDTQLNLSMWRELHQKITSGELTLDDAPCRQLKYASENTPWESK